MTTAQGTVGPGELGPRSHLKENSRGLGMGIHFAPKGRPIVRLKGVQEKQGLDLRPVQHGTQALVAWELRRIVLEVWMTCHGSGSDQQACPCDSV